MKVLIYIAGNRDIYLTPKEAYLTYIKGKPLIKWTKTLLNEIETGDWEYKEGVGEKVYFKRKSKEYRVYFPFLTACITKIYRDCEVREIDKIYIVGGASVPEEKEEEQRQHNHYLAKTLEKFAKHRYGEDKVEYLKLESPAFDYDKVFNEVSKRIFIKGRMDYKEEFRNALSVYIATSPGTPAINASFLMFLLPLSVSRVIYVSDYAEYDEHVRKGGAYKKLWEVVYNNLKISDACIGLKLLDVYRIFKPLIDSRHFRSTAELIKAKSINPNIALSGLKEREKGYFGDLQDVLEVLDKLYSNEFDVAKGIYKRHEFNRFFDQTLVEDIENYIHKLARKGDKLEDKQLIIWHLFLRVKFESERDPTYCVILLVTLIETITNYLVEKYKDIIRDKIRDDMDLPERVKCLSKNIDNESEKEFVDFIYQNLTQHNQKIGIDVKGKRMLLHEVRNKCVHEFLTISKESLEKMYFLPPKGKPVKGIDDFISRIEEYLLENLKFKDALKKVFRNIEVSGKNYDFWEVVAKKILDVLIDSIQFYMGEDVVKNEVKI